jgi:hypothetical protein
MSNFNTSSGDTWIEQPVERTSWWSVASSPDGTKFVACPNSSTLIHIFQ